MFPKEIYINRRKELMNSVQKGIIIFPGNSEVPFNYKANTFHFRQDSNFLYFFGINLPDLFGLIDTETGEDYLFGNDIDIDDIIWMGEQPKMTDYAFNAGVKNALALIKLDEIIKKALAKGRKIHYAQPYRAETKIMLSNLLGLNITEIEADFSLELVKAVIKLRSVKDKYEIEEIERSVDVAYQMHTVAMKMAMPGTKESLIAGTIEGIALANGGPVAFPVILSVDGQTLHNHNHNNILSFGRMMVTDAGAESAMNYCSDITRTVPVGGVFDSRQKDIYETVLKANLHVAQNIKPGIYYKDLHLQAAKIIASNLKDLGLMKGNIDDAVEAGAHALFFPHGLGHMMGLDVHDMESMGENYIGYDNTVSRSSQFGLAYLRFAKKLEPGFVLTDEPGVYFIPALIDIWKNQNKHSEFINYNLVEKYKDFGGVRIEDDILVTSQGGRVLGKPIPKTVAEIEETMKNDKIM